MAYIHTLDSSPRVLLILNPVSGKFQPKTSMFEIVSVITKGGCVPTTLMTGGQGDAERFVETYADSHDIVVCCGGDGTLNETISGMMRCERRKPIGYIPCGSTNDMARTLKLPTGNVKKAAKALMAADNVHQDVGRFLDAAGTLDTRYFMYVASFGAFTKVSYATPRWKKNLFGHMAYIMGGVMAIGDIKPWHVKIECEQLTLEDDFAFGSVTNSTSIAGVLKLDEERVALNDGKFEVMLIRQPKTASDMQKIIDALVRLAKENDGRHRTPLPRKEPPADEKPMLYFFHTDHITFTPDASKPMPWTIDGEYGGTPAVVDIQNLHGAVELLRKTT